MARPTKDPSMRRKRWDCMYVTEAERAEVSASAADAGLSVSKYLLSLHRKGQVVRRDDWKRCVQLLGVVTRQLEGIAQSLRADAEIERDPRPTGSQTLKAISLLLQLERLVLDYTMPWKRGQGGHHSDGEEL